MEGSFLRFYVHERERRHHVLLWEWLLEQANKMGIRGGSAFRAMAGFGRHHVVHADHFFELAGSLTVEVEFIVTEDEARRLLDLVEREGVRVFYAHIPARFGVINPDAEDRGPKRPGDPDD
jgi:uncharacterized protein